MSAGDPDNALVTIDLSADPGPESAPQKFGRIVGGALLGILGVVLALACGAAWIASWFVESLFEWTDLIGDGLLFIGALCIGLAMLGFGLMVQGRRQKASYLEALSPVPPAPATTKPIL